MGIPKSAQIFIRPDSETGGYSYYIKKNQLNPKTNEKEIVDHKIQDAMAKNEDGTYTREPLQFDNFRFILREYRIIQ
jgi:type IV secretory pathway ATPase VirB11/archaellum biosynthesis ATPase